MPSDSQVGRFVWYELMTPDPAGAKRFYPEVTGWKTQAFEGPMDYTMWTNGGQPLGGVMELPEQARAAGAPPHWLAYIGTPDVDATAAEATKLGGTVLVKPQDIPNVGRFAVLKDPQGAVFAIYKSASDVPAPSGPPGRGEFSWHELATSDQGAAFEFYAKLFGWVKVKEENIGPGGTYLIYGRPGEEDRPLGGIFQLTPDMPFPPNWTLYVRVTDLKEAVERARRLGAQVMIDSMEVPGGDRIAQFMDPQGAVIALHEPRAT